MDLDRIAEHLPERSLVALLAALGAVALLFLVRWAAVRFTERGSQPGAATPLRRLAASIGRRSLAWIALAGALAAASALLTMPDPAERVVRAAIVLAVAVQAGLWGDRRSPGRSSGGRPATSASPPPG